MYTLEANSEKKAAETDSSGGINKPGFWEWSFNLLLLLGILVGGLFVSNKVGAAGAGWAYSMMQSVGQGTLNWAKRIPPRVGSAAMRPFGWGEKAGGRIRGTGDNLANKKGWYNAPTRWVGKKITNVGGAVERAPSYKAPTLYQSIRKEIYGKDKKEVPDRIKQLRKDIDALSKERKSLEDLLNRTYPATHPTKAGHSIITPGSSAETKIKKQVDIIDEQMAKLSNKF